MSERILLAAGDENYLMTLALKFHAELDDNIELNVISDYGYLEGCVNGGYTNEKILIIGKEFFYNTLNYSVFESIIVLDESEENVSVFQNYISVNKFANVDVIYDCVVGQTSLKETARRLSTKGTSVIAVYSPIGGAGKTTMAYGLCYAFSKTFKKCLYVSLDSLQAFGHLFGRQETLPAEMEKHITNQEEGLADGIRTSIKNAVFDYLPPARMSMYALGLSIKNYAYLINEIKNTNEYDYIVVDMVSDLQSDTATIIGQADKVVCIGLQDYASVCRMERLVSCVDTSDGNKFLFVCNKYQQLAKNFFLEEEGKETGSPCLMKEYIDFVPENNPDGGVPDALLKKIELFSVYCM